MKTNKRTNYPLGSVSTGTMIRECMIIHEWRIIRNTRRVGLPWIIQLGYWLSPSYCGMSKGLNRRFRVEYEEFYATKDDAQLGITVRTQGRALRPEVGNLNRTNQ